MTRLLCLVAVAGGLHTGLGGAARYIGGVWDSAWYAYDVQHPYTAATVDGRAGIGFYPGYPLLARFVNVLLRALAHLVPSLSPADTVWWSLLIVSNACLAVTLVALWRLFVPRLGERGTLVGIALFLAAPGSFVLSAGFSESAFIAATVLAFLSADRRRWVLCGVFAGAAGVIRLDGALLILPLAVLWLIADRRLSLRPVVGLAAALAGVGAYPLLLWVLVGNPLYYVQIKDTLWGNHWDLVPALGALLATIRPGALLVLKSTSAGVGLPAGTGAHPRLFGALVLLNPATFLAGVLSIPASWVGFGLPYALWVFLAVLAPVSSGIYAGLTRYTLAAWPMYFALAWLLRRAPAAASVVAVCFSMAAMLVVAFDYTQGYFVV